MRQSPIIVRLGTDSVNPFRQQIYKFLVNVALKPQTAKPPAVDQTDGFALVPHDASLGQALSGGVGPGAVLRWVRPRKHTTSPAHFLPELKLLDDVGFNAPSGSPFARPARPRRTSC